ncbi:MAG: phosphotransferase [Planctomycetaceae bacterium]
MLSADEIDLVRRDPRLPGLATVLDEAAFRRSLSETTGRGFDFARIQYVRYKPARRCLVQYEIGTGGDRFDVVASALSDDGWAKHLQTGDTAVGSLPLPTGIPSSQVALSAFPVDRRLRCLALLLDAERRGKVLKRLFSGRPEWWNAELVPIAWRPSRRFVLRGDVGGRPAFALKGYCRTTFERALAATEATVAPDGVRVPDCVGCFRRHRLLAFEWLPGQLLADAIVHTEALSAELQNVGAALARFHAHETSQRSIPRTETTPQNLRQLCDDITHLCPAIGSRVTRLTESLIVGVESEHGTPTTIHGDFYAKQVLLNDGVASFIDFDETHHGSRWTDVGNFIAKLVWSEIRDELPRSYVADCRQSFLNGYVRRAGCGGDAAVRTYTAIGLLRCVPHPFRRGFPNWAQMMETLITRAEDEQRGSPPCVANRSKSSATRIVDDRMPMLEGALDPMAMTAELSSTGILSADETVAAARMIKHKPGRRCLIAYDLTAPHGGPRRTILGKIRAKGLDFHSHEIQQRLWRSGFSDDCQDRISVARPIGLMPKLDMWFQEFVPGDSFTEVMTRPDALPLAERIVRAIRKLQNADVITHRSHTMADELSILTTRLNDAAERHPEFAERIHLVADDCRVLAEQLPDQPAVTCHRDFFPDQVLVDGDRLWLLDFDLCCSGPPALDAANFIAHVLEQSLRQPQHRRVLSRFAGAMESAWTATGGDPGALKILTTISLARHIQISTQFPDRRDFTVQILRAVESRRSGLRSLQTSHR